MSDLATLVGVPYVERGRDLARDGGLDCYGLVRVGLARLGVLWPENEAEALACSESLAVRLTSSERPQRGDVVEMLMEGRAHVGLMVDGFTVLHAKSPRDGDIMAERPSTSVLTPLSTLRRLRAVIGVSRPRR